MHGCTVYCRKFNLCGYCSMNSSRITPKRVKKRKKEKKKGTKREGETQTQQKPNPNRHLGSVWLKEWKSERIENWEKIEKWKSRRDLVFSHLCLVGRMEKWRDGKLIFLVKKKNEKMENKVGINLQLCLH